MVSYCTARGGTTRFRLLVAGLVLAGLGLAAEGCVGPDAGSDVDGGGRDAGVDGDSDVQTPRYAVPYRAGTDHLEIRTGDSFRPLFVKGINLGVATPGTLAGELAATRDQYRRWLNQIRAAGFNTVRVYTLHYPRFYEEFRRHNRRHPDDPLYLLQGVWVTEDNATGNLFDRTDAFDEDIREVVDCVHGACEVDHRFGRAYGSFTADVSPWILGYVLGREFTPEEIMVTNGARVDLSSFDGTYFRVDSGDPVEIWFARRLETLAAHEKETYGVERPLSVANWPTLDPLDHPTESPRYSSEDVAEFDLSAVESTQFRGGLFASYHAYPYYPNFMSEDPDYRQYEDDRGPNAYLGYLFDLATHHDDLPVVIAEFGVPSSWVNAHNGYEGMNHGGHTEREQGEAAARMFENHYEAGLAGGALFSWLDEWWKPTWITNPRDFPFERRRLWHNVAAPEQNFGLIGFDRGPPLAWREGPSSNSGPIRQVAVGTDVKFFHVRLEVDRPLEEGERCTIGFDTYGDSLGESQLPGGGTIEDNRAEFALVVEDGSSARLLVTEDYDMTGIWYDQSGARNYRSTRSDSGAWKLVRFQQSQPHGTEDGEFWFEPTYHDAGELRVRTDGDEETKLDAVVVTENHLRIRIPWTYLAVVDPSRRRVLHDDGSTDERETKTTDGIGLSVAYEGRVVMESKRFGWQSWEKVPRMRAYEKRALPIVSEALESLPDRLDDSAD